MEDICSALCHQKFVDLKKKKQKKKFYLLNHLLPAHPCRLSSEEGMAWKDEAGSSARRVPSPASVSAPHAWLNRVAQEEEGRKRRGMEEEEEGRKGAGSAEEKEDEGRGKKDMQEKLSKLFSQPADPWASAGVCSTC